MPADGSIPALPGWRWVHTPGHTAGHVALFRDADRALVVGDAFCTTKAESFFSALLTERPELHGPPAYFTSDWDAARDSVRRLASLEPAFMAPGHGQPMAGDDATRALVELSVRFDEIAVKAGGGSSTGRLWIERVGGDTLRVALNTVVGTDTPTGRIFVTSDEAAVYFIVVAADAVSSVPWEQNSCWDYCARGTVKLRRL